MTAGGLIATGLTLLLSSYFAFVLLVAGVGKAFERLPTADHGYKLLAAGEILVGAALTQSQWAPWPFAVNALLFTSFFVVRIRRDRSPAAYPGCRCFGRLSASESRSAAIGTAAIWWLLCLLLLLSYATSQSSSMLETIEPRAAAAIYAAFGLAISLALLNRQRSAVVATFQGGTVNDKQEFADAPN